jgi:hypothetical protein
MPKEWQFSIINQQDFPPANPAYAPQGGLLTNFGRGVKLKWSNKKEDQMASTKIKVDDFGFTLKDVLCKTRIGVVLNGKDIFAKTEGGVSFQTLASHGKWQEFKVNLNSNFNIVITQYFDGRCSCRINRRPK